MRRYVYTFTRFWFIAVIPILVLPLAAFSMTRSSPYTFTVSTDTWADQSEVNSLIYTDQWSSPAQNLANYVNQLLHSSSFDLEVAHRTKFYWSTFVGLPYARATVAADLASNVQVVPNGANLVVVSYNCKNPQIGAEVVGAVLAAASYQTLKSNLRSTGKLITTVQFQLRDARGRLKRDGRHLSDYLTRHNIAAAELVTASQADPTLATLYQQVQNDQSSLQSAQEQIAAALNKQQIASPHQVLSVFSMVDPPVAVRLSNKRKVIMNLALALALGMVMGGGFIVLKTMRDRSVHWADEVPELLALPVLAVLPYSAGMAGEDGGGRSLLPLRSRTAKGA